MKRVIAAVLIVAGAALLAWAAYSSLRPAGAPYEMRFSAMPAEALSEIAGYGLDSAPLERIEITTPDARRPIATGIVTRAADGRLMPLRWRNEVTEPVFFADLIPSDALKVLAAIREHVPSEAVVLSWWDFSRLIRSVAGRQAPLDDPLARGLLTPAAWRSNGDHVSKQEQSLWGAGVAMADGEVFARFIDALLFDEARGAAALAEIAGGKPAYLAVRLSDIWKAAAAHPDRLSIAYKDFPGASGAHGVMKAASQWMQEQRFEGGYAVEPIGAATRLHYLSRKSDSELLIARLLPFSTSNPLRLERFDLVYQHKDYWIYKLKPTKS
jgi:hydroxylamine oxidation protein HaoB